MLVEYWLPAKPRFFLVHLAGGRQSKARKRNSIVIMAGVGIIACLRFQATCYSAYSIARSETVLPEHSGEKMGGQLASRRQK